MTNKQHSRREFLKRNSIAGLGAVLATEMTSPLFAIAANKSETPAILGGKSSFMGVWPQWPMWNAETDEKRLLEVIRSGVWSRQDVVTEFEMKWADVIGAKRCLMVVNGTNALIVSMIQSNIGVGDEVIIPAYTFIATAQAVLAAGAMPVFVDTDPETFQIDPTKIEAKITPRTRAIMPVHLAGLPADMMRILEIAKKYNLIVIEDACQAHLAEINHQKVGTFGYAGCFSFQNTKNLPIGEGGTIVSDDDAFMDRCYAYHNFGFPHGSVIGGPGSVLNGNKLRPTEYQAAIGLAQLARLEAQTATRNENATYLKSKLQNIPGILTFKMCPHVTRAAYHLFPFRYEKDEFQGLPRANFIAALEAEGVPSWSGYGALNTMPFVKDAFKSKTFLKTYSRESLNYDKYLEQNKCPENDRLCNEEAVWFSQNLLLTGKSEMDAIVSAIEKIHEHADKIKIASKK